MISAGTAGRGTVTLALGALVLLFGLSSADATVNNSFCHLGGGAGQCSTPEGLAVDLETNRVYVADRANNRIDVFKTDGEFLFAFGWGVDTGANTLETCTTASICQAGIAGSGAGQLKSPSYVAIDNSAGPSKHDIYVGEESNRRVQKFNASGAFLLMFGKGVNTGTSGKPNLCTNAGPPTDVCGAGSPGSGLGEFNSIRGVAVTGAGTVYVFDTRDIGQCEGIPGNGREFEKRLQKFKDNGEATETLKLIEVPPCGQVDAFAADSAGTFFIEDGAGTTRKYSSSATLLEKIDPGRVATALAVDSSGNVYAAQREEKKQTLGSYFILSKYDAASGEPLRRFAFGEIEESILGLAVGNGGHLFASERFSAADPRVLDLTEPAPGPIVPPPSLKATPGATLATLKAEVNPEGKASEFHLQYVTQQGYEEQGNSFTGGKTKETAPKSVGASDFVLHKVEDLIGCTNPGVEGPEEKCLTPETVYRFRILASNPDGSGNTPLDGGTFKTKAAPEFLALWSSEVGPDSATLGVELNPFLIPTQGFFEYVTEAQFQATGFSAASKAPAAGSISFGEGEGAVKKEVPAFPLEPATTYHYRLHATSLLNEAISEEGTFRTFATPQSEPCENDPFRYGLGALLPDCRAYEMVSPLEKGGADTVPGKELYAGANAALDVSSLAGDKLAYGTLRAFGDAEAAPYVSQYIAARDPVKGWLTHSLQAPKTRLILPLTGSEGIIDTEFKAFSPDLCQAWFRNVFDPLLDPSGIAGYPNLYRRVDQECEPSGEASYEAITRGKPLDLAAGVGYLSSLALQGVAADGSAAIYVWRDNLEGASPPPAPQPGGCGVNFACDARLYEQREGGPPEFVCILPSGGANPGPCRAGTPNGGGGMREPSVHNAISADGERVFWSAADNGPGPIYVRIGGTETVAVSKAAEEEAKSNGSQFWAASEDGSKAILTTGSRLYEFAVDTKVTTLVAKGVKGVVGASEAADKTYFVSTEAIAGSGENSEGDKAIAGKPNLYLREAALGGGISFIATVATADVTPGNNPTLDSEAPLRRGSRINADGISLAFMSAGRPTGYDNTDANSGEADTEVYLYDAGEDKLLCASCNPSGGRPRGELDQSAGSSFWAAAKIPTWTNILYAPRVLSDDGSRLFFESPDTLVARDTNGERDVYEWEAPGVGTCTEANYTYSAQSQGCVDLISSGKGARGAEFVDASPSGEDVFFSYQQSLVGQDTDDLVDIYDARIDGGFAPPPPPLLICGAEACQQPAEGPQFQTPSSEQYEGPGDEEERPKKKKKHKHKRKHHKHQRRRGR